MPADREGNHQGSCVRRHLETEKQLAVEHLSEFLRALLGAFSDASRPVDVEAYDALATDFSLRGLPIRVTPARLYRYVAVNSLLGHIAKVTEATRPELSIELSRLIEGALRGELSWEYVLSSLSDAPMWAALPLSQISLARRRAVFWTFDQASAFERTSTEQVWRALALWKPMPSVLLEICLERFPPDKPLRFPTVPDAGWYSFFRCAEDTEQHGWTNPHNHTPPLSPQPEAVMALISMAELSGPASLRVLGP